MKSKKTKFSFLAISFFSVLISVINFSPIYAQDDIDSWCEIFNTCDGYAFGYLKSTSGSEFLNFDSELIPLPNGSSFSSTIPFCSIYEYDTKGDDDAAWACTWEEVPDSLYGDAYNFTLESINSEWDSSAVVKAIAGILDTNVFQVNQNWEYSTKGFKNGVSLDYTNNPAPMNSLTIVTVDIYHTSSDDDFAYMVYTWENNFYAHTFFGNKTSYIHGRILNITPPSNMFFCQDHIRNNNQTVTWDSRVNTQCGNLSYSKQKPLVIPSIYVYRSLDDYMDKDFGIVVNNQGVRESGNSVWVEFESSMKYGNSDSLIWHQMSIIGYR